MANRLGVHASHVQRDYVHGWVLAGLFGQASPLGPELVLKGGNCLRKGYFEAGRYSADLDFSCGRHLGNEWLGRELNAVCAAITQNAAVEFDLDRTRVAEKRHLDGERVISEARLYFRDFYGEESELVLAVRLDVTQFDRLHLPIQERQLIHPYSDQTVCSATIRCVKLEEVLASKMRCLLQRRHVADLFDLAYATLVSRELDVDRSELLRTFFRMTVFESSPGIAKALFLDLPRESLRRFWDRFIACPTASALPFEGAVAALEGLVNTILPGEPIREGSSKFFASKLRRPIMEAAESMTLLRICYGGGVRLVEPYSLQFKVRTDGIAREYLYVWDRTGGRSGPGIKSLLPGRTEWIENTTEGFEPRAEVELKKAGSREAAGRFGRGTAVLAAAARHEVQCNYCYKRFPRKTRSTLLRSHKDRYGNRCPGRRGTLLR